MLSRPMARGVWLRALIFSSSEVVGGFGQEYVALAQVNHAVVGAEGDGGIDQRLHDFVQAERRTADDLKGVCGSRLLRERLFEVACPRLHLLK